MLTPSLSCDLLSSLIALVWSVGLLTWISQLSPVFIGCSASVMLRHRYTTSPSVLRARARSSLRAILISLHLYPSISTMFGPLTFHRSSPKSACASTPLLTHFHLQHVLSWLLAHSPFPPSPSPVITNTVLSCLSPNLCFVCMYQDSFILFYNSCFPHEPRERLEVHGYTSTCTHVHECIERSSSRLVS